MHFYKKNRAFTLVELVVGITLIGIMAIAISNINFNRLSSKQKLDNFVGKVKTNLEDIRNNALLGKGVGNNLEIPAKWKIHFSTNNSGTILSEAFNESGSIISSTNLFFQKDMEINKIKCGELFKPKSSYRLLNSTGTIEFNGINIKLDLTGNTDCNQNKDKILELIINNKTDNQVLEINTVNGLIEVKQK